MQLFDRRTLLLGATALAIGTAGPASSADDPSVAEVVEALTKAMLEADRQQLSNLAADHLSYGHSSGKVEDKSAFVENIATRQYAFKRIDISGQTIDVVGDNAIVRHLFTGEVEIGGKVNPVKITVLQVWKKQDGAWKLLARQAVPAT